MRKTERAAEYFRTHCLIIGRVSSESGRWFTLIERRVGTSKGFILSKTSTVSVDSCFPESQEDLYSKAWRIGRQIPVV